MKICECLIRKAAVLSLVLCVSSFIANAEEYTLLGDTIEIPVPQNFTVIPDEQHREMSGNNDFNMNKGVFEKVLYWESDTDEADNGDNKFIHIEMAVVIPEGYLFPQDMLNKEKKNTINDIKQQTLKQNFHKYFDDADLSREVILREELPFAIDDHYFCNSTYISYYPIDNWKRYINTKVVSMAFTGKAVVIIKVTSNCRLRPIEDFAYKYLIDFIEANPKPTQYHNSNNNAEPKENVLSNY